MKVKVDADGVILAAHLDGFDVGGDTPELAKCKIVDIPNASREQFVTMCAAAGTAQFFLDGQNRPRSVWKGGRRMAQRRKHVRAMMKQRISRKAPAEAIKAAEALMDDDTIMDAEATRVLAQCAQKIEAEIPAGLTDEAAIVRHIEEEEKRKTAEFADKLKSAEEVLTQVRKVAEDAGKPEIPRS